MIQDARQTGRQGQKIGVATALAAAAVIALTVLPMPTQVGALGPSGESVDIAIRFRQDFGLRSDRAWVESVAADSTNDSATHGVPLTQKEEDLMAARLDIQASLQPIRDYGAEHSSSWGGIWLTYPDGGTVSDALMINVGTTGQPDVVRKDLRSIVPDHASLNVHRVSSSKRDLDAIQLAVIDDDAFFEKIGTTFFSIETNVPDNIEDIAVSKVNDVIRSDIEQRYGSGLVRVEVGEALVADTACHSHSNCGPPWRGGLTILPVGDPSYCTAGFIVRKPSGGSYKYGMFTAGHCGNFSWDEGNYATGNYGSRIGNSISSTNHFEDGSAADVQVIGIDDSVATNQVLEDLYDCSDYCLLRSLTVAQQGHNADEFGDEVCNHGTHSGFRCGILRDTDLSFTYEGVDLVRMRRATYYRQGGDSGGPVVWNQRAAGSHTHYKTIAGVQYGVYSQIWEMTQATGYTVYLGQ